MTDYRPPFESDRQRRARIDREMDALHRCGADLWVGVVIVTAILLAVTLVAWGLFGSPAIAQGLPLMPPLIVRLDAPAIAYAPDGSRIALPAGAEIDACASAQNSALDYVLASRVVHVPAPCGERPIFRDGFEGSP